MANTLFLMLEGPLQSWGERAKWDVRDSAPEPTKSGVVGLLACCLGLSSDDDLRCLSRQVTVAVRCDRPGTLIDDFHTISGGIMGGEGKVRPDTVVSRRQYLCDAAFLVAVHTPNAELIDGLAQALQAPHWPLYLGRKCCPPSRPPFLCTGDYPTLTASLQSRPCEWGEGPMVNLRAVIECEAGQGVRRRDELLSRSRRTFGPRYTREELITVLVRPKEDRCTSPA